MSSLFTRVAMFLMLDLGRFFFFLMDSFCCQSLSGRNLFPFYAGLSVKHR